MFLFCSLVLSFLDAFAHLYKMLCPLSHLMSVFCQTSFLSQYHFNFQVSCLIKYLVFGFNVFFWFIGIAICAAGFYAWIEKDTISNLSKLSKIPFDPALVLIVVGGVMFILGGRRHVFNILILSRLSGVRWVYLWMSVCLTLCSLHVCISIC